ncbi:MAG TPA: aminopeptidase P family protein [Haliscomenobacter sp.]|uniref:aminopeptidase P family protein n=1 Tax=Haliscomenobacter sp. TaxID=2717303 RepID=UPI002C737C21|nr:aminopeptidase P family protein [Haliscomenobacter sp.]HOY18244.1 aminopeptidase P family protein [Haliscomenobacter sp.]HPH19649.1 aminopeptidase P family protein [Haliscomenobacter sp.]
MFSANTYAHRRAQLMQRVERGLIFLLGNELSPMNYQDNTFPFRQDSNFLYYIGLDNPHLAAILDTETGETILFGDELSLDDIIWMGAQPALKEQALNVGIGEVQPFDLLLELLSAARKQNRAIHFLPPYRAENKINLAYWLHLPMLELTSSASVPLIQAIVVQRSVKTSEEIAEMDKALHTTKAMYLAAMKQTRPGIKEAQLAGIAEGIAVAGGGNLAYPIIMTVNGQVLHNHHHHNTLKSGQLVLADMGAETAMHYAADITRTWPVDGSFTQQQKEIYQIVLDAQLAGIAAMRPGLRNLDAHLLAAKVITNGLKSLGLMQGDTDEIVHSGAHALFFPHGLGHMIGLDVHDMEDLGEKYTGYHEGLERSTQFGLKSLRMARTLEPGFVMTIEPGIYFIPELIDRWQQEGRFNQYINYAALAAYRGFSGIRIEDDVLVTQDEPRVLGPGIPKEIGEIEALRS